VYGGGGLSGMLFSCQIWWICKMKKSFEGSAHAYIRQTRAPAWRSDNKLRKKENHEYRFRAFYFFGVNVFS
jgi:hypothetical protein